MLRYEASLPRACGTGLKGSDFSSFQDGLDRLSEAVGRAAATEPLLGGVRHFDHVFAEPNYPHSAVPTGGTQTATSDPAIRARAADCARLSIRRSA